MFSLQTALDERLARLKKHKVKTAQEVTVTYDSKESITLSLKKAGILNNNGKIIKRNFG